MFEEAEAVEIENNDQEDGEFILDHDQLDSILAEAQTISPSEKAQLDTHIEIANKKICSEFEGIITPLSNEDIKKRFVFVDSEIMSELENAWAPRTKEGHSYAGNGEANARTFQYHGKLVVERPFSGDIWNKLSADTQRTLIEDNGDENAARAKIKESMDVNTILHETTHLYQSVVPNRTTEHYALIEVQGSWAGRELADDDQKVYKPDWDKRVDFYQHLIDKYGKDLVHAYAMTGKTDEDWVTFDIDDEFTEEVIKDLFPSLKYKPRYSYPVNN